MFVSQSWQGRGSICASDRAGSPLGNAKKKERWGLGAVSTSALDRRRPSRWHTTVGARRSGPRLLPFCGAVEGGLREKRSPSPYQTRAPKLDRRTWISLPQRSTASGQGHLAPFRPAVERALALRCYGLASTVIGLVAAVRVGIVTLKIARAHKAFQWRVRIWRKPTCEH
jgi:hypothetical protein